jgi:alkaline phosphatase
MRASIDTTKPKHIICSSATASASRRSRRRRYYGRAAPRRLNLDALRFRGDVTTDNVSPAAASPYPPKYVPDSAPTAPAWSSGSKTVDGRLGQGPSAALNVPGANVEPICGRRDETVPGGCRPK